MGNEGVSIVQKHLKSIRKLKSIDYVIANGENAANGKGINRDSANRLFDATVDIISMGNHTFNHRDVFTLFDDDYKIIRPYNLPVSTPGCGYIIDEYNDVGICVINLLGKLYMTTHGCPFRAVDEALEKVKNRVSVIIVDFHAEATSEKIAMGRYLDGRVSAVLGTHTHVVTADEKILENKTAYITDVGMTGSQNGIIGAKTDIGLAKFTSAIPHRFELAEGNAELNGVIIDVDDYTGKASAIERICIK